MNRALALLALAGFTSVGLAQQPAGKPDPAKGQDVASKTCVACHGQDGNSQVPENPKLAGQVAEYLAKQLANYKANDERKNPVMFGMVTPLSDEDIRNVSAYYATQKSMQGVARSRDTLAAGRTLYRGGNVARALPACAGCHGATGEGVPSQFPRVAGQHAQYLEVQLKAFRSGERANDGAAMMRSIAARLTDAEIRALSDYIAGLR
ncbi:MAG: cytochrome c4 [Burkholderiales bacterium]|nr:cytochrome c4 [Burkholderiales bacterium]